MLSVNVNLISSIENQITCTQRRNLHGAL